MFEIILKRLKDKIRKQHYVMTLPGEEEMNNDGLTIYTVKTSLKNGL